MILTGLKLYLGYILGCILVPLFLYGLLILGLVFYAGYHEVKRILKDE